MSDSARCEPVFKHGVRIFLSLYPVILHQEIGMPSLSPTMTQVQLVSSYVDCLFKDFNDKDVLAFCTPLKDWSMEVTF